MIKESLLKKADFPLAPMLLTFILGDQMEYSLVQSMTIFKGDVTQFLLRSEERTML